MFSTPAAWFPSTSVHNGWLTEACALAATLFIALPILGANELIEGRVKRAISLAGGSLVFFGVTAVLWYGWLNKYPLGNFDEGAWAQQVFAWNIMALIMRHVAVLAGLAAIVWSLHYGRAHWHYYRQRFDFWLYTAGGMTVGLVTIIMAGFVRL